MASDNTLAPDDKRGAGSVSFSCSGEELVLLPTCGLYLPSHEALLVADPHFGKDASFRKGGVAVPQGSSEDTLELIQQMLRTTQARKLVFLGDLFHARCSLTQDLQARISAFFQEHCDTQFYLTLGNHDVATEQFPADWDLEIHSSLRFGSIVMEHFPREPNSGELLCCGHLHPSVRLPDVGKLSCFWLHDSQLVLPAIGRFTGTASIKPGREDTIWVTDGESIHSMPAEYLLK